MKERKVLRDPRLLPQLSALRPLGPDAPSEREMEYEKRQWGNPKAPHLGGEPKEQQKLRRVTSADRRRMDLAISANRRRRRWFEIEQEAKEGPQACRHCGKEPCGLLWPEAACCHRCSHEPMRHWQLSHVLRYSGRSFFVMEVTTGGHLPPVSPEEGDFPENHPGRREYRKKLAARMETRDAIYYRMDGTIQWVRRARTHYFLGQRISPVDFIRALPTPADRARFSHEPEAEEAFAESLVERAVDDDVGDVEAETIDPTEEEEDDDE